MQNFEGLLKGAYAASAIVGRLNMKRLRVHIVENYSTLKQEELVSILHALTVLEDFQQRKCK